MGATREASGEGSGEAGRALCPLPLQRVNEGKGADNCTDTKKAHYRFFTPAAVSRRWSKRDLLT